MEDRESLYKGKKVVMWLRFGYAFSKKGRVGYDFARDDEDLFVTLFTNFIYLFHSIDVV
jgi:hypothetical protein